MSGCVRGSFRDFRFVAFFGLVAVAAVAGGCGRRQPDQGRPSDTVHAERSGLTVLTRNGWTGTASVWTTDAWKAFDGDSSTSWSTEATATSGQWFQVDMLSRQVFGGLTIETSANEYPRNFDVKVSNDASTWTTAGTFTASAAPVTVTFPVQTARYVKVTLTAGFSSWWVITEFKVLSPVVPRTGWTATASANPGSDTPDKALDATVGTRWSTSADQAPGQFFRVDMQVQETFNQITLDAGSSTGKYPRGYEVYVSDDGTNWGSAVATGTGTTEFISITFPWQWARYIKVVQTATSAGNVWAMHELNVYGQGTALSALSQAPWSATASPTGPFAPSSAIDANQNGSTYWTTQNLQTNGQWFKLDMGMPRTFGQLTLFMAPTTDEHPRGYDVHVSNDGTTWGSPVASGVGTVALTTISFPRQTARYVRITQTGTSSTRWWSINELNVFGYALSRLGWVATSSANVSGETPTKVLDNSTTSRWTTSANQSSGQYLQVDMVTPHVFNEITLDAGPGAVATRYPHNYEVRISNDGTSWGNPIATGAGTSGLTTIKFLTQTARFIKITLTGTASVPWSVYELEVWRGTQPCDTTTCTASDTCHTAGTCDPYTGTCSNPSKAPGSTCDDLNACTTGETCNASAICSNGSTVTCTGADQCHTVGACVPATGCPTPVEKADGTACNDSNACTQTDTCLNGNCTGANPVTCTASDQCHDAGTCNTSTGTCSNPAKTNGSMCNDGNVATQSETCQAGSCEAPQTPVVQNVPAQALTSGGLSGVSFVGAQDINSSGQVVGSGTIDGVRQALQWNAATPTQITNVGALPGFASDSSFAANSSSGIAVGYSNINPSLPLFRALRYSPTTGVQYFDFGDNAAGWNSGGYFDYGSKAAAVNAAGQFGGSYTNQGESRGFRYTDGSGLQDIGALQGRMTMVFGINESGRVVGSSWVSSAGTFDVERFGHAVMFDDPVTGLVDLNSLVDPMLGWTLYVASDINEDWVVGTGLRAGKVAGYRLNLSTGVIDEMWPGWAGKVYADKVTSWGAVLGHGYLASNNTQPAAYVYTDQVGYKNLNDIVDPSSGWTVTGATAFSETLDIVGFGSHDGVTAPVLLRNALTPEVFCQGRPVGTPCDDGNACTTGETCDASAVCGTGTAVTCPGADQCNTVAACVPATGCPAPVHKADNTDCNDSNACTQSDKCQSGVCTGANPVTCVAMDQCHGAGTCNTLNGVCSNPPKPKGSICSDGNPATQSETCQAGICTVPTQYPVVTNVAIDDLGLRPGGTASNGNDINDVGQGVGGSTRHAMLWDPHQPMFDLNDPDTLDPTSGASAFGVNESGAVVGNVTWPDARQHAFRYSGDGGFVDLGPLGDGTPADDPLAPLKGSGAHAINEAGQITGYFTSGGVAHAFRWTEGTLDEIDGLEGHLTLGSDIDDGGRVFGSSWVTGTPNTGVERLGHAFIWVSPEVGITDLNILMDDPTPSWVLLTASSAAGDWVVGAGLHEGQVRPYRMNLATGHVDDLWPGVEGPSVGSDINSNGDVVGWAYADNNFGNPRGFLYTDKLGIKFLNDLVDPAAGWNITDANGINESGDVTGKGTHAGRGVAYRLHDILSPQLACEGKGEGALCNNGYACNAHNVCHDFVCGGGNPADAICLRADGVVDIGGGTWVAVFGFDSYATSTVIPTINEVRVDGAVVPYPVPAPPAWLPTGSHPGAFLPRFGAGHTISWRVNGQIVTASETTLPKLTPLPGRPDVAIEVPGAPGQIIVIKPSAGPYADVPPVSPLQPTPQVGARFKGALTGALNVSSTGAAVYTVPINTTPGITGMTPRLSLVYNSQGLDGIAGQGWSLEGVSMIHRCPKTAAQDGFGRDVALSSFFGPDGEYDDEHTDGVCLDGQRLFKRDGDEYELELTDHSKITRSRDASGHIRFTVVTKSGETRTYGFKAESRVDLPNFNNTRNDPAPMETAIWALDRTVDVWGNYVDYRYVQNTSGPTTHGRQVNLELTRIDYTGHTPTSGGLGSQATFSSVAFHYEPRSDVRRTRFGSETVVVSKRLTGIDVPTGTYKLSYLPKSPELPSRLSKIEFCSADDPSSCVEPLDFEWDTGPYGWAPAPSYAVPTRIDLAGQTQPGPFWSGFKDGYLGTGTILDDAWAGSQFIDLNGDGRLDLVHSFEVSPVHNAAWENTGHGFSPAPSGWQLPSTLAWDDASYPGLFVDVDGDGVLDFVKGRMCRGTGGCAGQARSPLVWLNRIKEEARWVPEHEVWGQLPAAWGSGLVDFTKDHFMFDINGDGLADLIRVKTHEFKALINNGAGWRVSPEYDNATWDPALTKFMDVNHDGLYELCGLNMCVLNSGRINPGGSIWIPVSERGVPAGSVRSELVYQGEPGGAPAFDPNFGRAQGDIDGDGRLDLLISAAAKQSGDDCDNLQITPPYAGFGFTVDFGYVNGGIDLTGWGTAMNALITPTSAIDTCATFHKGMFALSDVNGDGLADLMIERLDSNGHAAADIAFNNGATWERFSFPPPWVPTFPAPGQGGLKGRVQIDLDGDGLVDLAEGGKENFQGVSTAQSWRNTFKQPVIKKFPNGLARPSEAEYVAITSEAGASVYHDTPGLVAGTKYLAAPLRVIKSIVSENPAGVGDMTTTTYKYDSLRASTSGRGPLGFHTVTQSDSTSGITTVTTYLQAFPFTGLVDSVERYQGPVSEDNRLSTTDSGYCDKHKEAGVLVCSPPGAPSTLGPQMTRFVAPSIVIDTSFVRADDNSISRTDIRTDFDYDDMGNAISTEVTTIGFNPSGSVRDRYSKSIKNVYGEASHPNRDQLKARGLATRTTVTSRRHVPTLSNIVTHVTEFDYAYFGGWLDDEQGTHPTLALFRTRVEPNTHDEHNAERHTVYGYDAFGHVTQTTACASNFDACTLGAIGPAEQPFRTTSISYDPSAFTPPSGDDEVLKAISSPRLGRFPVTATNAAGHVESYVYDPVKATLLQKTSANGLTTRYEYDEFGRQFKLIERAGGANRLVTESHVYYSNPGGPGGGAKIVTVTTPPTGASTLAYTNVQGRTVYELGRAFNGGFTRKVTSYNPLGQVVGVIEPQLLQSGEPTSITTYTYDSMFHRLTSITRQLGDIDETGPTTSRVNTLYLPGGAVKGEHAEDVDRTTHQRIEAKNALGKVSKVYDAAGGAITYDYNGEGAVTDIYQGEDGEGGHIVIAYDSFGRKRSTTDPDSGTWYYYYDGFGDLITQVDANDNTTTMTYDTLGRMITKTNDQGVAYWVFDVGGTGTSGAGQLAAMISAPESRLNGSCTIPFQWLRAYLAGVSGQNRAVRTLSYDSLGQLVRTTDCTDGQPFMTDQGYDGLGRPSVTTYPEADGARLRVGYRYAPSGLLHHIVDASDESLIWGAQSMNALGQVTEEVTRSNVFTTSIRNPATGWLMSRTSVARADGDSLTQAWSYHYDVVGNLMRRARTDSVTARSSEELFEYDQLDRVSKTQTIVPYESYDQTEIFDYDAYGNMSRRGKNYSYSGCGGRPHALCSVGDGPTFAYDNNGNMRADGVRTFGYSASNRPNTITRDAEYTQLAYGADGNRVLQSVGNTGSGELARTVYVGLGATGKSIYERTVKGNTIEHVNFIYAGAAHDGNPIALKVLTQSPGVATEARLQFNHFDHLGSITAVSDEIGHVAGRAWGGPSGEGMGAMGYDTWGARRNPDGRPALPGTQFRSSAGRREFTGHEAINNVGVINMNGRLYDPALGRFLAADPTVQSPGDLQNYNRYSYVLNNPLRYTDPTGYHVEFTENQTKAIQWGVAILGTVCTIATDGICAPFALALNIGINAALMLNAGAPFSQILVAGIASVVVYGISQGIGVAAAGVGPFGQIVVGAYSGMYSTIVSTMIMGGELGRNVLDAALQGAFVATVSVMVGVVKCLTAADEMFRNMIGGNGDTPSAFSGSGPSRGFDVQNVDGRNQYRLNSAALKGLQRPFGMLAPGLNLDEVEFIFNPAEAQTHVDPYTRQVILGMDFLRANAPTRDFLLVHELTHVAQIYLLGWYMADMRAYMEAHNAGNPYALYERSGPGYDLRSETLAGYVKGFSVVDSRFPLEAIAQHIAYQLTLFHPALTAYPTNYW
jgi:RHS repeat-associated protein